MFLRCLQSWDGRLFLKGDMMRDSFFSPKLSTVWQKCPSNASLLRRIRAQEVNTIRYIDILVIQL